MIPIRNTIINKTDEEEKEISEKIITIINNVNSSKAKMKTIIDILKEELNKLKDEIDNNKDNDNNKDKPDEAELRLKRNLFDAMIKKYQHTMQRFQEEESKIKSIKETKLIRGAEIALGQELDEQERKEIIENPQMVKQIYVDKLGQKASDKLINALRDLEERHKKKKKLEKSVLEVHKMIMQLNLIVQYQGEMIDNIVTNINIAKDAVIKGEKNIDGEKKKMECTKKIKCIIMIVVLAALLIIIIPIIIKLL